MVSINSLTNIISGVGDSSVLLVSCLISRDHRTSNNFLGWRWRISVSPVVCQPKVVCSTLEDQINRDQILKKMFSIRIVLSISRVKTSLPFPESRLVNSYSETRPNIQMLLTPALFYAPVFQCELRVPWNLGPREDRSALEEIREDYAVHVEKEDQENGPIEFKYI